MSERVTADAVETIQTPALKDGSLTPLTGLTSVVASVQRVSDRKWLDWDDDEFKDSSWTERQRVMSEVDASLSPGQYACDFDLAEITNPVDDDTYMIQVDETTGAAKNAPLSGEIKVGQWFTFGVV